MLIVFPLKYCILLNTNTMITEISLPPKHQSPDTFCLWTIKTALKNKVAPRIINQMGLHKWWLLRNYSNGSKTPETYAFFVNINTDRPQITEFNTAMVAWSPIPFGWTLWDKVIRTLKRTNYPNRGDAIQIVSLNEHISFIVRHMSPMAFKSKDSRQLWNVMQANGWELVAQGETQTSSR